MSYKWSFVTTTIRVQSKSIARVFDHLHTVAPSINFTLSIVT